MSHLTIWKTFRSAGLNEYGTAALMGNLYAESVLRSNNLQDTYERSLGMSDEQYTDAVNAGTYSADRWATDAAGFGLAQWTFHSRKRQLLTYAKTKGVSIDDEQMQCEFCLKELNDSYPALIKYLKETDNLYEATRRVCAEYENPAVHNVLDRYGYAKNILDECTGTVLPEKLATYSTVPAQMPVLQKGDKGLAVGMVQFCLVKKGYSVGSFGSYKDGIDCDFGSSVANALTEFKRDRSLQEDGIVDAETWEALYE